jgi:hypothetical protein
MTVRLCGASQHISAAADIEGHSKAAKFAVGTIERCMNIPLTPNRCRRGADRRVGYGPRINHYHERNKTAAVWTVGLPNFATPFGCAAVRRNGVRGCYHE